jgi:hypothetical protein
MHAFPIYERGDEPLGKPARVLALAKSVAQMLSQSEGRQAKGQMERPHNLRGNCVRYRVTTSGSSALKDQHYVGGKQEEMHCALKNVRFPAAERDDAYRERKG